MQPSLVTMLRHAMTLLLQETLLQQGEQSAWKWCGSNECLLALAAMLLAAAGWTLLLATLPGLAA